MATSITRPIRAVPRTWASRARRSTWRKVDPYTSLPKSPSRRPRRRNLPRQLMERQGRSVPGRPRLRRVRLCGAQRPWVAEKLLQGVRGVAADGQIGPAMQALSKTAPVSSRHPTTMRARVTVVFPTRGLTIVATDDEQSEMTIKKPALRYELNLNTVVQLVGFALLRRPAGRCGVISIPASKPWRSRAQRKNKNFLCRGRCSEKRRPALSHHGR
jgi:hypothetical protein